MDVFEFHTGYPSTQKTNQSLMECPFCNKEKFYFEKDMWSCKSGSCGKSGNNYTFLNEIYEQCTTQIARLAAERQLPQKLLIEDGWRYNPLNRSFVCPTFRNGKLNNLYKFNIGGKVLCSPGLTSTLQNDEEAQEEEVWIVEGQWDYTAARAIIGSTHNVTVYAVPGSETFKDKWVPRLKGKKVTFLYDNDAAGKKGIEFATNVIAKSSAKPTSVSFLSWPETFKEKGDLRDLYVEYSVNSYEFIKENSKPYEGKSAVVEAVKENIEADTSCKTFEDVIERMKSNFHVNQDMVDALLITFCSIYSNKTGGEQLWFRLIGPPGAGKTTIVNCVSACEQVVVRSTFTGLFSGFQSNDGTDASMIPLIQGRTLMVKDADALLRQPNIERIMSELRDFYDKNSSPAYRNQVSFQYENVRSTFILCGTNALRRADNSFLGERFLQVELRFSKKDELAIKEKSAERSVLESMSETDLPGETTIKAAVKGFVEHMIERTPSVAPSPEMVALIQEYGTVIAKLRTVIERDRDGEPLYTAQAELPTRLIKQLIKLCATVHVVLDREDHEYSLRIIKHVVRSTLDMSSRRLRIVEYITDNPDCTAMDLLQSTLGLTQSSIQRELIDLKDLDVIKVRKDTNRDKPGKKPLVLRISSDLEDTLKELFNVDRPL